MKCDLCEFETGNGKIMSNHKRWKHLKISFSDEARLRIGITKSKPRFERLCQCSSCGKSFTKELTEDAWRKIDREGKKLFCSRSCASRREWDEEKKEKAIYSCKE